MNFFIFLGFLIHLICQSSSQNFDTNYVGVAFSPYVKQLPAPGWDSYSTQDIKDMLNVVSTRFSRISTYSMGVDSSNVNNNWDDTFANCRVARAASQINQDASNSVILVNIGVYQFSDQNLQQTEINNAFSAAQDANNNYNGTVWGITFTNEFIQDYDTGGQVLAMLQNNRNQANNQNLLLGTRINRCDDIVNNGPLQNILTQIAQASDYIYCNLYPQDGSTDPGQAAQQVGADLLNIKSAFQAINSNLDVQIGETGWPSDGDSFDHTPNTVQNLVDYWNAFGTWASQNQIRSQIFEAIDEPWKSQSQWSGEAHYGWWTMPDNNNVHYVEKASGGSR